LIFITDSSEVQLTEINALYFYTAEVIFHTKFISSLAIIEKTYPTISFFALDLSNFPTLIKKYKIDSLPTILLFNRKGKKLKQIIGTHSTNEIKDVFEKIYNKTNKVIQ
jgi:thioredoxin-related protein